MCRSIAEGGQRCAAHTRPAYLAATFGTPEWDEAAAQYASTPTGQEELSTAWYKANDDAQAIRDRRTMLGRLRKEDRDAYADATARVTALDAALTRGTQIRLANLTAAEELNPGSVRLRRGADNPQMPELSEQARTFAMAPDPTDPDFPGRAAVSKRSWDDDDPTYSPNQYVTPKIAKRINAGGPKNVDPTWHREWEHEVQWADGHTPRLGSDGLPLNPAGRTGLTGLGGCKRLGENKAADPVLTREDPATGKKQVLLGYKETEQQWALPGGSVDEGEDPAVACSRELREEVGLSVDMSRGKVLYQGFVDDHRNTDNAWFSTQARHVHLTGAAAQQTPVASDDISAARWVDVDTLRSEDLFASHGNILKAAGILTR